MINTFEVKHYVAGKSTFLTAMHLTFKVTHVSDYHDSVQILSADRVVGVFGLKTLPGCSMYWVITGLEIVEEFRRKGIALAMNREVIRRAREAGAEVLATTVSPVMTELMIKLGARVLNASRNARTNNWVTLWHLTPEVSA